MLKSVTNIYEENKVKTASPPELTLMLYEGMVKFANITKIALEKKRL